MKRTSIVDTKKKVGKEVLLKGFVHETRDQSKINFVLLRDRTGIVQLVVKEESEIFGQLVKIPRESVIAVKGTVKKEKQAPSGVEVQVKSYELISEADRKLPIPVVEKTEGITDLSKRLDWRWIDLRKPKNLLVFRVWTILEEAMREYWSKNGFIQVYSPKFMGAPSESGAETFEVEYFEKKAYLAQSPQFYKQMAMASGFEKIFEIGPVFRSNPSHTTRHDSEFTMVDMEISYIDSHEDVMKLEEEWLAFVLKRIKERAGKEIKEVFGKEVIVPKTPFPRITMKEALGIARDAGLEVEGDLGTEGERAVGKIIKEKFKHDFVFVTEYPWSERPFYHMKVEGDKNLTKSYDLLWGGLEITTGAQREHRPEILRKQAIEKKINLTQIEDYLNFFKYGCPPHGGFGLSPTRMLMILLGIKNVREATFLPRDTMRLRP